MTLVFSLLLEVNMVPFHVHETKHAHLNSLQAMHQTAHLHFCENFKSNTESRRATDNARMLAKEAAILLQFSFWNNSKSFKIITNVLESNQR